MIRAKLEKKVKQSWFGAKYVCATFVVYATKFDPSGKQVFLLSVSSSRSLRYSLSPISSLTFDHVLVSSG